MKLSPHTAPMTYGLKLASFEGLKPFDYLYPAGTGGCGSLRFLLFLFSFLIPTRIYQSLNFGIVFISYSAFILPGP